MDKSCHSSGDSTTTTASSSSSSHNNNSRDQYLRHLNKISHKISKPVRRPGLDHHQPQNIHQSAPPPPPQPQPQPQQTQSLQQQQQQQPPVYNINKSDFRDVVQKLTGSPAHERFSTPPPIQPPKPQSSRLQRIRPPPLAQISNRPPPLLNNAVRPLPPPVAAVNSTNAVINTATVGSSSNFFGSNPRQVAPLSPLPPFPAVHAAAESPISAYMRYLQSSVSAADSDLKRYSGLSPLAPLVSPRWNSLAQPQPPPPPPPPPQQQVLPSATSASMAQNPFLFPSSPVPFGCMPSPNTSLMFSPSATGQLGFQQFPVSPRLPVPSPRWKDL